MTRLVVEEIAYGQSLPVFARFAALPGALFLDSALAGGALGRYSFVAADPFRILRSRDGKIQDGARAFDGDPLACLSEELARYPLETQPGLPPFQTGVAGYFAYDLAQHLERLPKHRVDDQPLPDMLLGFYGWTIAFDHEARRAWIMANGYPAESKAEGLALAGKRLAWVKERLAMPAPPAAAPAVAEPRPDIDRPAYESMVRRVIDYILAGDIYQANLSQRFTATLPAGADPFHLYCNLRRVNPAPFAAYFRHQEIALLSASPERFLRLDGRHVETRPIKGTRPRGRNQEEDAALAEELLASKKDRAENLMIVDLLRNDLSRVCADHSVDVPMLFGLESFATVHHLVSVVTGELRPAMTAVDLLRAAFPGGSITGAPKIRAMEIIAELEPNRRGPYCGSIGYIGFDGSMDTNIVIRTMAVRGRQLSFQVGGGIVADSDPGAEYEESLTKAKAMIESLAGAAP
ncbi:MAG TPA: aminodeoxychorismate synthase, component I [Candidatus Udaeobacter sp.]|nr:aminodeoxychorismate synthase, component I [Candidatus Udaeobacter sp.]